ncbi:aminotransferase class I/II-fold pyridoxal phosphate-dependent enzyme, partial [Pelagibacteraceae bacterium]|nr:aminotransferase class I/II-fold pyridoxal phosphate-dependent enzyme [Pelagibacteraceae bacterium]
MKNKISKNLINLFKSRIKLRKLRLHEPDLSAKDVIYLKSCILSNSVSTEGNFVKKFENKIGELTKSRYVVATNSGTSALHVACILMNVKENDEVLIPSFTFVGTANAVKYCGAIPHFVDIEEEHFGINISKLSKYLKKIVIKKKNYSINKLTGRRITAVIPVHVFGHFMEINELIKLAKKYNLAVIEDSAEAIGSYYRGKHAGTFGNIGILSFNGNKTITCGSGGAILTNDLKLSKRARHLISTAKKAHPYNY